MVERGDIVELTAGRVAHGGHWVARHEGQVLFVRHTLEGERIRARVTATAKRHAFATCVEVLDASPHRVAEPCPIAPDCGGCDFQHVELGHQRELKRQVVAEQLRRLAGLDWTGVVEAVDDTGLGWRTRVRYAPSAAGWGMHPHRSDAVTPLPEQGCLIAAAGLERPDVPADDAPGEIRGVADAHGATWAFGRDDRVLTEHAAGRTYGVRHDGFWQVHPRAAQTLADAVLVGLNPRAGESALDLFCGVGLFAGALASRGVRVDGIEGSKPAVALARTNVPEGRFVAGDVATQLRRAPRSADLVVLDPPRVGAGAVVLDAVASRHPRAIAYVACDPAALARDLGHALGRGWRVDSLRAFDLFGMTHHVECVAILVPDAA